MVFDKAKAQYTQACQIFINLLKMTTDDPNLQAYLNQQCTYAMNKAETCHKNVNESLKSKNQAGFLQNNLTGDAVKELGK